MKCVDCRRPITTADARRMVAEYSQPDDTTLLFGHEMPNGTIQDATGRLVQGWHLKCFHARRRREARGDAVTGRVLAGGPSGYTIADYTIADATLVGERLDRLRQTARSVGKGVGDGTVLEAFWAQEHGGPYPHNHHLPLDTYQLLAHLEWAHGSPYPAGSVSSWEHHAVLHAQMRVEDHTPDTVLTNVQ